MNARRALSSLVIILPLLMCSCATVKNDEGGSDYRKSIRRLQERLVTNPQDVESLRDLGVIYFQTKQYKQAKEYLKKASELNSNDAKTMFYFGMTLESENNKKGALAVYINYTDFSALSSYRKLMEGRYQALTRELIQEQFRTLIAQEETLTKKELPRNSVAVFPLVYQGKDTKFSSLGLGLSEMMIIDLAKVKKLKLIERIRVDELMNELRFGASSAVDPTTAPRLGRFLTAGRIVGGTFNVSDDNSLRLDVASLDVTSNKGPQAVSEADALDNLFKIEKEIVFKVIKDMGLPVSREERESIQSIPTKNLQAFFAYSLGLEKEAAGDFEAAGVYYKQAGSLDPSFGPAVGKAGSAEALSLAGGSKEKALASAYKADPPPKPDATGTSLVTDRVGKLQNGIGSGFMPGEDSRKPAEEAANSGAPVGELPAAPPPPK